MIIAKPNTQTLFSFGVFALASACLIYWNAAVYFFSTDSHWYNFGILLLLAPVLIYVLYRLFFQLKRMEIGNNQFTIYYLFYGKKKNYQINDIKTWREHQVRVGKSTTYKELEILFTPDKIISIGKKEYTEYDKILAYLRKKSAKREVSS